jgi:hypothetical protein
MAAAEFAVRLYFSSHAATFVCQKTLHKPAVYITCMHYNRRLAFTDVMQTEMMHALSPLCIMRGTQQPGEAWPYMLQVEGVAEHAH